MNINVAFLYGGRSTEHEISIISAVQAMNNLDKEKYTAIPIYMDKENRMYYSEKLLDMNIYKNLNNLKKECSEVIITKKENDYVLLKNHFPYKVIKKIDIAFPIMHGYNTEDGSIAGYLEVLGIPYCESDIYASVVGQDKVFQKEILKNNGISVVDYVYFYEYEYLKDKNKVIKEIEKLGFPVIVKPARQGSSVGIGVAHDKKELTNAIEEAITYDEKILVEKIVTNLCELNCSVLGTGGDFTPSLIEEVYSSDEILSFNDKYMSSGSKVPSKGMASAGRKVPADISKEQKNKIEQMSVAACRCLNTSGIVRIDYLMDKKTGIIYLNELNIIPGSLAFYLWTPKDVKYQDLLSKIIECGIKKYQDKAKKMTSFESNVLEGFSGTKGVKK